MNIEPRTQSDQSLDTRPKTVSNEQDKTSTIELQKLEKYQCMYSQNFNYEYSRPQKSNKTEAEAD